MIEFIVATLTLIIIAYLCGGLLGYASVKYRVEGNPIVEQINQVLPQTQCGQCGYPGCKPYAEAIAEKDEAINRCPPGGEAGIKALAELLDVEIIPLDQSCGEESKPKVAVIREDECIGCTKCIQACPVDAIVGAAKHMHTVIESECTGCDLCVPPCPVDCIDMVEIEETFDNWKWPNPLELQKKPEQEIPVKLIS
ncbi:electron transport complex subunit RsxB [Aliikangiella sp. G2MR2-5]|uniref:electron transport complex subunit RsxB n=1 Tax=Aliikangiella sp. G2MR2-5 TaxID=2788943 RepID=UPI0018ABA4B8|nr:electron transport complex subunit RsxB [Aliikangiella sp. G2MR2-5]